MQDTMGDRMKDLESRTRYFLPRRCYTLLRIDGKAFHTYTRGLHKPFDLDLKEDMQLTTKYLCQNIQGAKIGYTQSDEISLVLTDFDDIQTSAWFDGNLQKISSVAASLTTGFFNAQRFHRGEPKVAFFDCRAWSISDPWEVFNTFWWRQKDCTRNAIQMVARSLASHKECENKNFSQLNELIHSKGQNFNDYPTDSKRGTFVYRNEEGWFIDKEPPILSEDRKWFFDKLPMMPQVNLEK